ncbi:MAG: L-aspartate oxidase [Alphaproteobacteria bacterium]|nr:L-aspartate oxidase [Alphaproteobacteria bacterium]
MNVPVIIGGGLAALSTALALAPYPVVILGRKTGKFLTSSELAQGGIAAAVGPDDNPVLHAQDTLAAGGGLCDPRAVQSITAAGPRVIEQLIPWGVPFDRDEQGRLNLALEGGHGHRRIVHAKGDATGAAIMRALMARVRSTPSITFLDSCHVTQIDADENGVTGITFFRDDKPQTHHIKANNIVLASGSACALWRHTTVPALSWGEGLLLAAQKGAILRDLEFVQFHPTALDIGTDPMPLLSEALRGEGARLVDDKGEEIVDALQPRDIVARALWDYIEKDERVFLDTRDVPHLRERFPSVFEICLKNGLDPREMRLPVRPVAHYHMGGIETDLRGRTALEGLWACGECACTGLHGANRLASNSLLEAVVMGMAVAQDMQGRLALPATLKIETHDSPRPYPAAAPEDRARVRNLMIAHVGMRRTATGLKTALSALEDLATRTPGAHIGHMIAQAALWRPETRGAHDRTDFLNPDPQLARSNRYALRDGALVPCETL